MSQCPDPGSVLGRVREGDGGPGAEKNSGGIVSRAVADRAIERWRARRRDVPPPRRLELWEQAGFRIVCPEEPEWPTQLDDLGDPRPVALWLSRTTNLPFACLHSVSVVGSRAATAYGSHLPTDRSAELDGLGWTCIFGGAFRIVPCAPRGALAGGG